MGKNLFKPVRCAVYIWPRHMITRLSIFCLLLRHFHDVPAFYTVTDIMRSPLRIISVMAAILYPGFYSLFKTSVPLFPYNAFNDKRDTQVNNSTFLPFVKVCCCHRNNRRDTHTSSYHKLLLELDDVIVICGMERAECDIITARESDCSRMHSKVSCKVMSKPRDRFSRYSRVYPYLYSTSGPPCPVTGWSLPLPYIHVFNSCCSQAGR